ncbi:hypothetical protein GCM10020227_01420 [Streptomyces flavovirens]
MASGGGGDQPAQIGVGVLEFGGEPLRAGGEPPEGFALFGLGAQDAFAVRHELGGGGQRLVRGLDEGAAGVEQHLEVVPAPFEGSAELVDDGAQRFRVDGGRQVVDAGQDVGDGGGDGGVGLVDDRAVPQEGAVRAGGPQVDVLLTDG